MAECLHKGGKKHYATTPMTTINKDSNKNGQRNVA